MLRTLASVVAAAAACVGCNKPRGEYSQSLVGANEFPSAEDLSRETLYITRGRGADGDATLSYELRPDNLLTVTHTYFDRAGKEQVKGMETIDMVPEVADRVRQLFWRVRPAKFEGVANYASLPIGCRRQGLLDFGEFRIAFLNEVDAEQTAGRNMGIFELPYPESCNAPAAVEARRVVSRALQLLPKSEVAAGYERAT